MAATTKSELLDITHAEFGKLRKLIEPLAAETALKKHDEDTSIKDVIAHRAHWIELFFGWYTDGRAGKTVAFPAKGYKWNDLKRYNADLRDRQSNLGWPEAVALLQNNHDKLTGFIESLSDTALYEGPMKGARNTWATGRWIEATGASHYRSASKYIRSILRRAP